MTKGFAAAALAGSFFLVALACAGEAPPTDPGPPPDEHAPEHAHGLEAVPAHVTTIDGRTLEGDVTRADATSITIDSGQGVKKIELADAIEIGFEAEKKLRPTGFQVLFVDGSTLNVEKIPGATEDALKVNAPTLGGELPLTLDKIMGVVFDVNDKRGKEYRDAIMTRQAEHDFVLLPNSDSVIGKLDFASWKDRAVAIEVEGQKREFKDLESVGVKLQQLAEKQAVPPLHVVASLIDGSELTGTLSSVKDGKLVIDVQGVKIPVITGGLRSLRIAGSRMKYLSELEPTEKEEYPLLKKLPTAFPMHQNHTCAGKPISLNNKSYQYGVGVHAYSHLTYALDQQFEMFYTLVGIDDNMSKPGKVGYQVLVDGEVKKTGTLSAKHAEALDVNVQGARKLELIVNFMDDSDQGDSVVWANARLIKKQTP